MSDFSNEIGDTLKSYLCLFQKSTICVDDIISKRAVEYSFALDVLFALYRRGYIHNTNFKEYTKPVDIDIADFFEISIEGIDYLELNQHWWMRFWFRSLGCPVVVSFVTAIITAINAECLWNSIKNFISAILPHLP